VLDETARTLDYPGFTQFDHDEKRREVEQLLKRQRVLLVLDNIETVTDGALPTWLLNLPEPSKALITSREKHRTLWSSWLVELRGMSEAEAQTLIAQRLQALQLSKIAGGDLAHFEPLITVTGGNPKAIEMTLGLVKHERRPLQQVVDDLYAARGNLFDDLFARAWGLLDEAARRVLLVATFFPASASAEALSATADVQGFAFDRAVERLSDLALLDVQQVDLRSPPRYILHPLVRAFAGAKLTEQPGFEEGARERWITWYVQLVARVGYCGKNLQRLELLDPEIDTVHTVLEWISQHVRSGNVLNVARVHNVLDLAKDSSYYHYVRGLWGRAISIYRQRIESARQLGDSGEEVRGLAACVQVLSLQNNIDAAAIYLPRLEQLLAIPDLPKISRLESHRALAHYWMNAGDLERAVQMFGSSVQPANLYSDDDRIYNLRWIALCRYDQGMLMEARHCFQEALEGAVQLGYQRGISFS